MVSDTGQGSPPGILPNRSSPAASVSQEGGQSPCPPPAFSSGASGSLPHLHGQDLTAASRADRTEPASHSPCPLVRGGVVVVLFF